MDALNWSEMTVKTFVINKTVFYIDNNKKCDKICDAEQWIDDTENSALPSFIQNILTWTNYFNCNNIL